MALLSPAVTLSLAFYCTLFCTALVSSSLFFNIITVNGFQRLTCLTIMGYMKAIRCEAVSCDHFNRDERMFVVAR